MTNPTSSFMAPRFSSRELRNSKMFDFDRRLCGLEGSNLLESILQVLMSKEGRKRARRPLDEQRYRLTLSVLIANLAAAALNRVDADRFVAVPFSNNAYSHSGLSVTAMALARDSMLELGLVEGRDGIRRAHEYDEGAAAASMLTRLRATKDMRTLFGDHGISHRAIERVKIVARVFVTVPSNDLPKQPDDVTASVTVLERANALAAQALIELPADAWLRIKDRLSTSSNEERRERGASGDILATDLFRSFKYDWQHGGRLYGGWWIGIPSGERPALTIDGEPTVELDYSQLHPSMLFAREGLPLDFDLYTLPGHESSDMRQLGKETFARLLNGTRREGQQWIALRRRDFPVLPPELTATEYMRRFRHRLSPIARWLLAGEGLRLQREDSDLAIAVIDRMTAEGITTLPVHDSFIVQEKHERLLFQTMTDCYRERHGFTPTVKGGKRAGADPPLPSPILHD